MKSSVEPVPELEVSPAIATIATSTLIVRAGPPAPNLFIEYVKSKKGLVVENGLPVAATKAEPFHLSTSIR